MTNAHIDPSGILDEALQRLHTTGPEHHGRLSNHAPMAVEALAAHGRAAAVHRWLDRYAPKLDEFPSRVAPVTDATWADALGDIRRAADWIDFFDRELAGRPWRAVLAEWWPRLLTGLYGAATHPLIRVGHAVRTLLATEDAAAEVTAPRLAELGQALGYWAARHLPVTGVAPLPGARRAADALDAVPPLAERRDIFPDRLALVTGLPVWADGVTEPESVRARLTELVHAATHRYATHGHGEATMLVHSATAPNAVLRVLPALPHAQWAPSLAAAWTAAAAVTAMYGAAAPRPATAPGSLTAEELVALALAHGDEHVIKLTDTALDVGDGPAFSAALRAIELSARP
ncbi:questin oxidase family protein [Streptomyces sp. NPDC048718]|uniref:questin oxidase family protein n=1 Tax=Streptomyces sp. NPDC048718 TaxID=3365587 RepID=UPI00371A9F12